MKDTLKIILCKVLHKNRLFGTRKVYKNQINERLRNIVKVIENPKKEIEYYNKWSKYDRKVSTDYYKVYCSLSGDDSVNYVPDYLYYTLIEPQLNNYKLCALGEEKNYYDKLFSDLNLPRTILRNINGIFFDERYKKISLNDDVLLDLCNSFNQIFIKPTIDTGQGRNVSKFVKSDNIFHSKDGMLLTMGNLLDLYGVNFIVQECLPQSSYISQFNEDSVNTLRILTYRSVINDEVHVLHTTFRVGKKGSIIDASRAGGRFCGVNSDGSLIEQVYDSKGNLYDDFNGVNLRNKRFVLPNFDSIIELARNTASQVHHHRVLALDIMIDSDESPRLIEVNTTAQGMFIFQASIGPMFREFTDEVLDYCGKNYSSYISNYSLNL
jgi:hypothetical protein